MEGRPGLTPKQSGFFLLQCTSATLTRKSELGIDSTFGAAGNGVLEAHMPGDPKECRLHALKCAEIARTSPDSRTQEQFAQLAQTWLKLASDLEQSQAILDAWGDPERKFA
jgi:hypothetical protein